MHSEFSSQLSSNPLAKLSCCFLMITILFSVSITFLSSVNFFTVLRTSKYLEDFVTNWQTHMITDITTAQHCPQGYEVAFSYIWPGTGNGCWCGDAFFLLRWIDLNFVDLYNRACDFDEYFTGCKEVRSTPQRIISEWGHIDSTSMKLCVKRSKETWVDYMQNRGDKCKESGMKQCGNSKNHGFCTKEEKCPINDISIQELDLGSSPKEFASCDVKNNCVILSRDQNKGKIIQYQRGDTLDASPLVQLKINEYSMCTTESQNNISPDRQEFKLMRDKRTTCDKEGETMWKPRDYLTETQVFQYSNLSPTIKYLQSFGFYERNKNGDSYQWGLFSRSYFNWDTRCLSQPAIAEVNKDSQRLNTLHTVLFILAIIFGFGFGIIYLTFALIFRHLSKPNTIMVVLNFVFKVALLIFVILCYITSKRVAEQTEAMPSEYCSNPDLPEKIVNSLEQSSIIYQINNVMLYILGFAIWIDLIYNISLNFMRNSEENYARQRNEDRLAEPREIGNIHDRMI